MIKYIFVVVFVRNVVLNRKRRTVKPWFDTLSWWESIMLQVFVYTWGNVTYNIHLRNKQRDPCLRKSTFLDRYVRKWTKDIKKTNKIKFFFQFELKVFRKQKLYYWYWSIFKRRKKTSFIIYCPFVIMVGSLKNVFFAWQVKA